MIPPKQHQPSILTPVHVLVLVGQDAVEAASPAQPVFFIGLHRYGGPKEEIAVTPNGHLFVCVIDRGTCCSMRSLSGVPECSATEQFERRFVLPRAIANNEQAIVQRRPK